MPNVAAPFHVWPKLKRARQCGGICTNDLALARASWTAAGSPQATASMKTMPYTSLIVGSVITRTD